MDIQKVADSLRDKAAEKKKGEAEQQTKERMKSILSRRDEAMRKVFDYQNKTGVPSDEEVDTDFLNKKLKEIKNG